MNSTDRPRDVRRHARLTALRDDERGFTLVEMLVAILILGIILTAMASVIITSLTSMQRDEQRVRATQLAQEELERLRAIDWDCVGFPPAGEPSSAAPYSAYNGNTTAEYDVADCTNPGSAPSPAATTETVDGIGYTVQRHVYWIDDPEDGTAAASSDSDPEDYKEFTVDVTWTLRGQTYTHTDSSTRVPTVEEKPLDTATPAAAFEITSMTVNPAAVTLSSGRTTTAITVVVETSTAASSVTVAAPGIGYSAAALNDISSGAGTRWQKTIASNTTALVGTFPFIAAATGTGLGQSDTESTNVTFANAATVVPVVINTPLLSRGLCASNGNPKDTYYPVTVTVDVNGVSATDPVKLSWTDVNGSTVMVPLPLISVPGGGTRFSAIIPAGTELRRNDTTLTIDARRVSDNTVAQGTFTLSVVSTNKIANCP